MTKRWAFGLIMTASVLGTAAAQAEETDAPKPEKKICRTERATGSLTRRNRICMTKEEWNQLEAQSQKNVRDFQSNSGSRANTGPSSPFGGS